MARFVRLCESRDTVIQELAAAVRDADANREREYRAAVSIQSWFRGCRVRAYLAFLNHSALVIQRNYRAYIGREFYRHRLKECLEEMRRSHYHTMAVRIQGLWRGYYVRKYVFDYYAQREYLEGLVRKNELVRQRLEAHWEVVEEERALREERLQELQTEKEARRHHYMLSTKSMDGVFKPSSRSEPLPFERRMRAVKFTPRKHQLLHRSAKKKSLSIDGTTPTGTSSELDGRLPPVLTKTQGPFRSPEDVCRQRFKPLSPTLRVATDFNAQEIARAEMKSQEWRNRVIDEKFLPFSRREYKYNPLLHTRSPYERPLYGTKQFRDEYPAKITQPFRTVVPPIPVFDKLNSTY